MHKNTFAAVLVLLLATIANGSQSKDWVRYESVEGRFAVLMPDQPEVNTQEGKTPAGATLIQHQAKSKDSESIYSLGYFDLEANSTYSLDKGRDGMVTAVKGTLISEQAISLGGNGGGGSSQFQRSLATTICSSGQDSMKSRAVSTCFNTPSSK